MLRRQAIRRSGPGILGTVARTAVIAGTATVTSNAISARQQARYQQKAAAAQHQQAESTELQQLEQQVAQLQASQIQAQVPAGPVAESQAGGDLLAQLTQLGDMKERGLLSDDEFQSAKSALLAR